MGGFSGLGSGSSLSSGLLLSLLLGLELVDNYLYRGGAMDSAGWALAHAHAASLTLLWVDVSHVVLDDDSLELTGLLALATTDTSAGTSLAGNGTLVLVDTANPDALDGRSLGCILLADLEHELWTSLGTGATSYALVFVHLRQTRLRVHVDGIEGTSLDAVAQTDTTEGTARLTSEGGVGYGTRLGTIEGSRLGAALKVAVAA